MNLDEFIANDQYNLEQIRHGLPFFSELMPQMNALYVRSLERVPKSGPMFFGQNLLLCHKAFLCAAVTIARRHPDDAAPITRRAIELALLVVAVKHDPTNRDRWLAEGERLQRWEDRHAGQRPKPFQPKLNYPSGPGVDVLRRFLGTLSDAFVHATPEFMDGHEWQTKIKGDLGDVTLSYVTADERSIEQQLLLLGGVHTNAIDLFDECFDGNFRKDETWLSLRAEVERRATGLAQAYSEAHPDEST